LEGLYGWTFLIAAFAFSRASADCIWSPILSEMHIAPHGTQMYPHVALYGGSEMKIRIPFTIPVALVCILLAQGAQPKSSRIGPPEIYPDPVRTPGAANPQVTQGNIQDNICNRQWSTKQIRPPSAYTSKLKRKQLREYGDTVHQTRAELINPSTGKVDTTRCVAHSDNMACYEEDHLISLENGGDPTDPRNLFPEPYNTHVGGVIMGAHQKDVVEGFIHDEICYEIPHSKKNSYIPATTSIKLQRGQQILAGDWYACYQAIKKGKACR